MDYNQYIGKEFVLQKSKLLTFKELYFFESGKKFKMLKITKAGYIFCEDIYGETFSFPKEICNFE